MKNDGALPATFLGRVEFAQMRDDALPRPGIGANALEESKVGVNFAVFGAVIASKKHGDLLATIVVKEGSKGQWGRFPLQRQNDVSTTRKPRDLQETGWKIARIFYQVRNTG